MFFNIIRYISMDDEAIFNILLLNVDIKGNLQKLVTRTFYEIFYKIMSEKHT